MQGVPIQGKAPFVYGFTGVENDILKPQGKAAICSWCEELAEGRMFSCALFNVSKVRCEFACCMSIEWVLHIKVLDCNFVVEVYYIGKPGSDKYVKHTAAKYSLSRDSLRRYFR